MDTAENVYVSVSESDKVLKLAPDGTQTKLPFSGVTNGVAVDTAGNVYLADVGNNRVLKLSQG